MSRTIGSHVVRTLTTGGLLAGASLIAPAIASSQSVSPNRAFLSQSTLAFSVNRSLSTVAQAYSSAAGGVDGERALLGHVKSHTELQPNRAAPVSGSAVVGERALLGRRNSSSVESE